MSEPTPEVPEDPPGLVITTAELARRAGLTVTAANHATLVDAIVDATDDVVGYLGRGIVPRLYTEYGLYPYGDEWPLTPLDDPVVEVTSVVAETYPDGGPPTGYFTVSYLAGLDVRTDESLSPILRYIRAHALNDPAIVRLWEQTTAGKPMTKSVTAEGQSITWERASLGGGGQAGSGVPGSLPKLSSLDQWRVGGRRVFQRRSEPVVGDWPYRSLDTHRLAP